MRIMVVFLATSLSKWNHITSNQIRNRLKKNNMHGQSLTHISTHPHDNIFPPCSLLNLFFLPSQTASLNDCLKLRYHRAQIPLPLTHTTCKINVPGIQCGHTEISKHALPYFSFVRKDSRIFFLFSPVWPMTQ